MLVLLAFALTSCAMNTPLPQTINIEQPSPNEPKEAADYIGAWKGTWDLEIYGIREVG